MGKTCEIAGHVIPRAGVLVLIYLALSGVQTSTRQLTYLLLSGALSGTYHGLFTLSLWRKDDKDKHKHRTNAPYEINTLWVHLVCGLVASACLYLLANKTDFRNSFSPIDIFFLIIALVGYAGLLPRTLWFFSYNGDLTGGSKGK